MGERTGSEGTVADRIAITGLRSIGRHGVFAREREGGQPFVVDVCLVFDAAKAAVSDDLSDTVDYGEVASQVAGVVSGEPVNLIETLAQRIADVLLVDSRLEEVEVTVHKPEAPIPVPFDDVAVTIVRSRR